MSIESGFSINSVQVAPALHQEIRKFSKGKVALNSAKIISPMRFGMGPNLWAVLDLF